MQCSDAVTYPLRHADYSNTEAHLQYADEQTNHQQGPHEADGYEVADRSACREVDGHVADATSRVDADEAIEDIHVVLSSGNKDERAHLDSGQ